MMGVLRCRIRVQGHFDRTQSAWSAGLTITNLPGGETPLAGPLPDQAALHGVLARVRDLGLPLLAVQHDPAGTPGDHRGSSLGAVGGRREPAPGGVLLHLSGQAQTMRSLGRAGGER